MLTIKSMTRYAAFACLMSASLLAARASLRAQDDADHKNGIYLEQGDGAPNQLVARTPPLQAQGIGTSMGTFGFKKPRMVTTLPDEKATIRTAPTPSFLFVFGHQATLSEQLANPSLAQSALRGMPPNASTPKDFSLVRLAPVEGNRIYDSGKGLQAKFVIESVGPRVYRVHPAAPLEPGEYAFSVLQAGAAAQVWDFGVDTAK